MAAAQVRLHRKSRRPYALLEERILWTALSQLWSFALLPSAAGESASVDRDRCCSELHPFAVCAVEAAQALAATSVDLRRSQQVPKAQSTNSSLALLASRSWPRIGRDRTKFPCPAGSRRR